MVTDAIMCGLVRYLGITLEKGLSLEMRSKTIGPEESKIKFIPFTVACQYSEFPINKFLRYCYLRIFYS